jgi:hypothetical protein
MLSTLRDGTWEVVCSSESWSFFFFARLLGRDYRLCCRLERVDKCVVERRERLLRAFPSSDSRLWRRL